jgi:uncharacterized protein
MRGRRSRALRRLLVATALAGLGCAAGQAQAPQPARLVVDASSVVEVVPDLATLRVTVVADADEQDAALLANARIAAGVIARARQSGVEAKDIDVGRIKVSPRYETLIVDGREERGRQIGGYAASNTMTLTIRDIPRAGTLIRDLLKAGVNVIEDIQFMLSEDKMSAARAEVRAAALKTAEDHAETAARAAGMKLGKLIGVGSPPSPDGLADIGGLPEEPDDLGPTLIIEPGVIEVHDTVRVVWALER